MCPTKPKKLEVMMAVGIEVTVDKTNDDYDVSAVFGKREVLKS
jgi:hypothetical protein